MGKKYLSEKEFDLIKTLRDAGLKTSKIIDITGRSSATLSRASHYKTYEDYRKPKEQPKKEIRLNSVNTIDTVIKLLENIDERLKWIEENIPAQGSKKFWLR